MSSSLAVETLKQFRIIIGAARSHFRTLERACGISGAQVWILSKIDQSPGITVSKLSEALSVHVSTGSNMLNKLEKAGYIERQRGNADRRVVNLQLTKKGKAVLARAPQPITGLVPHALEKLPAKNLASLNLELSVLIEEMNLANTDAAHDPLSELMSDERPR